MFTDDLIGEVKFEKPTINVALPKDAGIYYLIFSNKFSLLTPKAVQANVDLMYYTH